MIRKAAITALLAALLTAAPALAQRYHYEVDQGENRVMDGSSGTQQDRYWEYRERTYPADSYEGTPQSQRYPVGQRPPAPIYPTYSSDPDYTTVYPYFLEFSVNQSNAELLFGHVWDESQSHFLTTLGAGVLYSDDEYSLFNIFFTLGNRTLMDRFTLEMGFKGVFGTAEEGFREGDVGVVGLTIGASQSFPLLDALVGLPMDLELAGAFTWAPSPVCFGDLDSYTDFRLTLGLYILEQRKGKVFVGYRRIDTSFDEGDNRDWDKDDGAVLFGFRFIF